MTRAETIIALAADLLKRYVEATGTLPSQAVDSAFALARQFVNLSEELVAREWRGAP